MASLPPPVSALPLQPDPGAEFRTRARAAAEDFEAFFLSEVFRHMFEGIRTDGLFDGGHAEEIYRSLMTEEYGKITARRGGVGIADQVYREMLRLQSMEALDRGALPGPAYARDAYLQARRGGGS